MPTQRLITLTTDFGGSDYFVGAMKGVILTINPDVRMVDITHGIQSYDVLDGALTIAHAAACYPADTIHLVVVDPGVGSSRRPILAEIDKQYFVAPDNGVLSLLYEKAERTQVRHITATHYFRQPVSNTFHGRDVLGPVAAWMTKGVEPAKFGEAVSDYVRFTTPKPKLVDGNTIKGIVLKTDKFGNLVTNLRAEDIPQLFAEPTPPFRIVVNNCEITELRTSYANAPEGKVFAILGSMGYLELSANRRPASQLAGAGKGVELTLTL